MGLTLATIDGWPIYGPDVGDTLPGVVILHGSEGPMAGWSHRFAAILASHGIMALPWSYGEGSFWAAGAIRDVDLTGVSRAGRSLASHPRVARVGLFGWSRGGEAAMHVATASKPGEPFECIAAHAASDVAMGAFDPERFMADGSSVVVDPDGPPAWRWPDRDHDLVPGRKIEIERWDGPLFLSVGDADEIWDHEMTLRLADRRRKAGRPIDLFVAEGQGHGFTFDAEPHLWPRLLSFFRAHLGGQP